MELKNELDDFPWPMDVIAFNPSLLLHSIRGIRGGMSTLSFRTLLVIVLQLREYFLNIITISHYKSIKYNLMVIGGTDLSAKF